MESFPNVDDPFPLPPPYMLSGIVSEQNVKVYQINSPADPAPPPSVVSPFAAPDNSRVRIVSYEVELDRAPGLMTCRFCQTQVITEVTFKVGTFAWLMCFLFVLCGLILGCCLIPFFADHFKDACHSCPRCHHVLHVEKRTCFK
uniref:Cell death-inducing p53-target protein 1 homolog n=1 Tax=Fundulus heteroclitus TaxID=8078 RepID=A0A146ZIE2_FUNHE